MSIYLDNAATTKVNSKVLEATLPWFTEYFGNASSKHDFGEMCKSKVEEVRNQVAKYINGENDNVYFCSSSSEANSWFYRTLNKRKCDFIVLSTDHIDSIQACKNLEYGSGFIEVDCNGMICVDKLKSICENHKYNLMNDDLWICFNLVNAETGVIQNIKEISDLVHSYNYHIFCDLTQAITHIDIDVVKLGIDACSFGSHKIGGIKGCGVLYSYVKPMHMIFGHQENETHGGTYNVPSIVSLGESLKLGRDNAYVDVLRLYFENCITNEVEESYIVCKDSNRINFISNVCFKGVDAETLLMLLSMDEVYCSSGSACNSYYQKASHVLTAIGMKEPDSLSCLRFSFSEENTIDEIDKVVNIIKNRVNMIRNM